MMCLDLSTSLTNYPVHGIKTAAGMSPVLSAYKGAWLAVHGTLDPTNCYLEFPRSSRRYKGDFDHHVIVSNVQDICERQMQEA